MGSEQQQAHQQFIKTVDTLERFLAEQKEESARNVETDPKTVAALGRFDFPAPGATPALSPASVADTPTSPALSAIVGRIAVCRACELCETRNHTVPGQGHPQPELMFVGEGPGAEEDRQGLAFVGRSGQLLTRIIQAMGLAREEVWIGNIVKCRPPGNRTPDADEMEACMPFLKKQLALLKPKVIVCLGATAVKGLLHTQQGITRIRGTWMEFEGIPVMPTFHPAYLLRNPAGKKDVWEDMKSVLKHLGRKPPPQKK